MSFAGVFELFRGRPRDPIGEGGRMSLGDHFRELRARVMRIALYLVVATIVALFFYDQLFQLILDPYNQARESLGQSTQTQAVITGVGTPLTLQLKICGIAAVVATSPLWLSEIWGFVVPGPAQERASLDPHLRLHGRSVVPRRRGARLLRAPQGHLHADRLHPEGRRPAHRVLAASSPSSPGCCSSSGSPSRSRCSWSCSTSPGSSPARRWGATGRGSSSRCSCSRLSPRRRPTPTRC